MATQDITLFQALGAKMDYLQHRQEVIARNISNADTPGYKAMDVSEPDFSRVLEHVTSDIRPMQPATTRAGHMTAALSTGGGEELAQKVSYEVSPTGNEVSIEEQMVKASRNTVDYNLTLNLLRKNLGMLHIALGSNG